MQIWSVPLHHCFGRTYHYALCERSLWDYVVIVHSKSQAKGAEPMRVALYHVIAVSHQPFVTYWLVIRNPSCSCMLISVQEKRKPPDHQPSPLQSSTVPTKIKLPPPPPIVIHPYPLYIGPHPVSDLNYILSPPPPLSFISILP